MFRLHDFACPSCHFTKEELVDVPPEMTNFHCPMCKTVMKHVIIGGKAFTFTPFWHPHLDHKPIYIKSWREYRRELRSRKLENEHAS